MRIPLLFYRKVRRMSILICGMKMPETCDDCPLPYISASYDKYMECPISKYEPTALKRNDDCPFIEIVHCKDCKWFEDEKWCCNIEFLTEQDAFCSYGERMNKNE